MVRILSDEELRLMAIRLLSLPTARTLQRRIGASDLANQCDRDLAFALAGIKRRNPQAERVWMGAEVGTSIHAELEARLTQVHEDAKVAEKDLLEQAREIAQMTPGAKAERHIWFGHIDGYGAIGGTIDLDLDGQIVDWKGSTRKKSCLLQDFIAIQKGEDAPFGRKHKAIAGPGRGMMPEREYNDEMAKMAYKMTGYYTQQQMYLLGREKEGRPVDRGSIIWINRDSTGFFDRPDLNRYDDPKAVHDVWPLTFAYNRAWAEERLARGQRIWDELQAGKSPADFDKHEHCWMCSFTEEEDEKRESEVAQLNLDAPVTFGKEAA